MLLVADGIYPQYWELGLGLLSFSLYTRVHILCMGKMLSWKAGNKKKKKIGNNSQLQLTLIEYFGDHNALSHLPLLTFWR